MICSKRCPTIFLFRNLSGHILISYLFAFFCLLVYVLNTVCMSLRFVLVMFRGGATRTVRAAAVTQSHLLRSSCYLPFAALEPSPAGPSVFCHLQV